MDESTTGNRLRRAIEEGPGEFSVRGFQREMEARLKDTGVRGYTYPSINSYLHDETSPSVAFLEQAADVLGVRLSYLAAGSGPMTGGIDPDALETKVLRGLGVGADSAHHPWADALDEARRRLEPDGVEFPLDEARDVTDEIIEALRGPLDALKIAPERMGWDAFNDYLLTMVPALLALAPEYERQRPYVGEQED